MVPEAKRRLDLRVWLAGFLDPSHGRHRIH